MRMIDIKEHLEILKAIITVYEDCVYNDEELIRQCLIKKMMRNGKPIFRWSIDWINKYRNGYLGLELYDDYMKLFNNDLCGNYCEENVETIKSGIELIESSIFKKL